MTALYFLGIALVMFTGCCYWLYCVNDTGLSWSEVIHLPYRKENERDLY